MAVQFESNVKHVPYSQERVYNKLSDLNNLEGVRERLDMVKDKLDGKLEDMSFDRDSITLKVQGGENCDDRNHNQKFDQGEFSVFPTVAAFHSSSPMFPEKLPPFGHGPRVFWAECPKASGTFRGPRSSVFRAAPPYSHLRERHC